jgi:hypothetical protein
MYNDERFSGKCLDSLLRQHTGLCVDLHRRDYESSEVAHELICSWAEELYSEFALEYSVHE